MSPTRFAVHRPVFTTMVVLMIVLLGAISLWRLPIDLMPDITYPRLSVSADYGNAGPEEMEELITRPLEEAVSAIPGVEEVSSTSAEGGSRVSVAFAWGTDLDAASNDIRDRIDRIIDRLPEDVERPRLRKFDLASFPILFLGVSSDLDPLQLRIMIDNQIKYRLERVPGVAAVDIQGGIQREIHVDLDADKVKGLGLSLDEVLRRLREENINLPAGTILQGGKDVLVRTPGEYRSLDEIGGTVVAFREGAPIRLRTIAAVRDTWRKRTQSVRSGGKSGMRISINKQAGTNTVEVAKGIKAEVERINQDLPQIRLATLVDTSAYIERAIDNVSRTIVFGGLLAVLVLLVFLRSVRTTVIIATSIPISVIATFTLMYFHGYTVNLMTLGGLALGVGMLVDNSIVVLENIFRYVEAGETPMDAAVKGGEEVTAAILASTLTTLVVFLPLIFVEGMTGVMLGQLAAVISFSLLCSLGVALTLVPMLAARWLTEMKAPEPADLGAEPELGGMLERALGSLEHEYVDSLGLALRHRVATVVLSVAALAACLTLAPELGVESMPASDEGEVRVTAEYEVGTPLDELEARVAEVERIVFETVPERVADFSMVGGRPWRPGEGNTAELRVTLRAASERTRSSEQVATELRAALAHLPGVKIRTRAGAGLYVLRIGRGSGERLEIEVRGHDLEVGGALAERVRQALEKVPGVTDVDVARAGGNPEQLVQVDRQKAAAMGLSVREVASVLETAIAGTQVGGFRDGGEEYPIVVKVAGADRMGLRQVLDLTVVNARGEPVVLRNVVTTRPRSGPAEIERRDQGRVIEIQGNFTGRDQGSVIADVRAALQDIPVPKDFAVLIGGDYEEQQEAFRELLLLLALSLVFVYMVMACQYESLRHPFVVMFSVPLAAGGVVVALYVTDTTFNFQSFVGCIMLGGIVVNNAILLVDQINLLRERDGLGLEDAVREAGRLRLRPILMTASTTVLGLLPMAMGWGEGGETQAPLARAVIGGLLSSTLITLVFVPVIYTYFDAGDPAGVAEGAPGARE